MSYTLCSSCAEHSRSQGIKLLSKASLFGLIGITGGRSECLPLCILDRDST